MPSLFNPNGTVPQPTATGLIRIASSINTSPIQITTTNPHNFNDGDYVFIEGHQTNTAADGPWQINRTSANTFNLIGSTGNGVGGNTGYCSNYSLNPVTTIPSSGDPRQVAGFNGPLENTANMVPYLNQRTGAYRTFAMRRIAQDDTIGITLSTTSVTSGGGWQVLTSASWAWTDTASVPLNIGHNDIVLLDFAGTLTVSGGSPTYEALAFGISINGGAWTLIPGSPVAFFVATTLPEGPVRVSSMFVASDLIGFNTPCYVSFGILAKTDSTSNFVLASPYHMSAQQLRSNWGAVQ